ncbi:MAG: hypothetical protein AB7O57_08000 [Hyphomicrobiaceae bacterium]
MKTAFAALLALGLLAGQASARTAFDNLADSAPRGDVFSDIRASAPRSAFDALRDTAPRSSVFDGIQESAPRSDGVFGTLEQAAP